MELYEFVEQQHQEAAQALKRRYDCEMVGEGMNSEALAEVLNDRWAAGWLLHAIFEQRGNTVIVYERWDN